MAPLKKQPLYPLSRTCCYVRGAALISLMVFSAIGLAEPEALTTDKLITRVEQKHNARVTQLQPDENKRYYQATLIDSRGNVFTLTVDSTTGNTMTMNPIPPNKP